MTVGTKIPKTARCKYCGKKLAPQGIPNHEISCPSRKKLFPKNRLGEPMEEPKQETPVVFRQGRELFVMNGHNRLVRPVIIEIPDKE